MVTPTHFLPIFSKPHGILDTEGKKNNNNKLVTHLRNWGREFVSKLVGLSVSLSVGSMRTSS